MMEVSSVLNTAAEPTSTSDALAILHTEPCAILRTVAFDRTSPREAQHLARLMNISLLKVLMRATRPDDIRSPNPTHYTLSTSMVPFLDELEGANPLSGLCAEEGRIVTALACLLRGVSSLLDGAFLASALRLSRPFPVLHRYIEGKANAADGIFHALQESGEQTRSEKNDDQDHLVAMLQYDERDFAFVVGATMKMHMCDLLLFWLCDVEAGGISCRRTFMVLYLLKANKTQSYLYK
jgi:hypothetical protein